MALDSIILFERLNLNPTTLRPAGSHCYGFDGFFFDTRFIRNLASSDSWLIGEPFWDYWLPLALIYAGAKLKMPSAPGLIHVDHDGGWRWDSWDANVKFLRTSLLSWNNLESAFPEDFVTCVKARQTKSEFANFLFSWLKSTAEPVKLSAEGTEGDLIYRFLGGLSESKEQQLLNELRHLRIVHWGLSKLKTYRGKLARLHNPPLDPQNEVLE